MSKDYKPYAEDILAEIAHLRLFTQGHDAASFTADLRTHYACLRSLEIIGEAVKRLPADVKEQHAGIPWRAIAGLRDVAIHDYLSIKLDRVWDVITTQLDQLEQAMQSMIAECPALPDFEDAKP